MIKIELEVSFFYLLIRDKLVTKFIKISLYSKVNIYKNSKLLY